MGERIIRDRRQAEDILHDVFVEAWHQASQYDPSRGRVRTWLLLRMRSRCLDRVRSAGYRRARPLPEREGDLGQVELVAREDAPKLHRALHDLPEDQRRVIQMGYFEGLSSSEIAKRERIPTGTVKSRTAAALQKLREAMRAPSARGPHGPGLRDGKEGRGDG